MALMLMISVICFVILPPAWIYAMFAYPEEFGPPGPRACDMEGYSPAPLDEVVKPFVVEPLKAVWFILKNAVPFFEYCIHAEWMSKNHPYQVR